MQIARNRALSWLEERGGEFSPNHQPILGKLGVGKGKIVGVESTKGALWSIRIDFDPTKGPHYNASFGKGATELKIAFTFPAAHNVHPMKWMESLITGLGDPSKRPVPRRLPRQ